MVHVGNVLPNRSVSHPLHSRDLVAYQEVSRRLIMRGVAQTGRGSLVGTHLSETGGFQTICTIFVDSCTVPDSASGPGVAIKPILMGNVGPRVGPLNSVPEREKGVMGLFYNGYFCKDQCTSCLWWCRIFLMSDVGGDGLSQNFYFL